VSDCGACTGRNVDSGVHHGICGARAQVPLDEVERRVAANLDLKARIRSAAAGTGTGHEQHLDACKTVVGQIDEQHFVASCSIQPRQCEIDSGLGDRVVQHRCQRNTRLARVHGPRA
jgi:hypothetical protein